VVTTAAASVAPSLLRSAATSRPAGPPTGTAAGWRNVPSPRPRSGRTFPVASAASRSGFPSPLKSATTAAGASGTFVPSDVLTAVRNPPSPSERRAVTDPAPAASRLTVTRSGRPSASRSAASTRTGPTVPPPGAGSGMLAAGGVAASNAVVTRYLPAPDSARTSMT
jgi:hypothetical protein